jgi:alkaline phosphatase D
MTPLHRRDFLKASAAAGAAVAVPLSLPRAASAQTGAAAFLHGVASGDPLGTAVVLWTRVTPSADATPGSGRGPAVPVQWELAADPAFALVVRRGTVTTDAARDHTVKVDVTGLEPYTRYWYRFSALGATSPTGRTQTAADDGRLHALRLALVSCSNWTGGYFSAYRHVADRDDLDVVVHLGDYIYEYGNGEDRYGPESLAGERDHVPATEIVTLSDYRQRQAQYKTDPDLQAAHAAHPWIVIFDDHEVTNDTWAQGAENHQPETEGDFLERRALAYQAYVEWMPIRLPDASVPHEGVRFFRRFSFGPLADLSVIDSRQNRSHQARAVAGAFFGVDLAEINDPARVLLEPEQMQWLKDGIASDAARWHLIGNQTVFTRVAVPRDLPGGDQLGPLGFTGPVFNTDQWDGYGDDQREVIAAMAASPVDTVVLTGDIHSSWANDIPSDPGTYAPAGPANNSVGVEFVCASVTSDGFTEVLRGDAQAQASTTGLQAANPHIRYLNGIYHGYAVLDVTPERVQTDFFSISDRTDPQATTALEASWLSERGSKRVVEAAAPIGARSDSPRTVTSASPAAAAARPAAARPRGTLAATGPGSGAVAAAALTVGAAVAARAARRTTSKDT